MNDRRQIGRLLAMAAGCVLGFASRAWADPDEAWLTRAPLPATVKPLLVIVLDTSAAMAERVTTAEHYDPLIEYAAASDAQGRCDPQRVYWRRGPGPAPDCTTMPGLSIAPTATVGGMRCDAAHDALERHGYFVAARAAQWRPMSAGGHWDALLADGTDAIECRSDRGLHGRESGLWYAVDGQLGPWSDSSAAEIAWDIAPHGEAYIFYTGNFLNYLASMNRTVDMSLLEAVTAMLVDAVDATGELDVALLRLSDREPAAEGGFVALAPVPAAAAAAPLPTLLAGWPASGSAPLAETLIETATWLSGGIVHYGNDARADVAARDPQESARYQSPFSSSCRPVTVALATAGRPTQDEGARPVAEGLPGFGELTGGCGASCVPALAQWLMRSDLRDDLPGHQSASVTWLTPSPATGLIAETLASTGGKAAFAQDPLAFANVVARSLQHDAAVAAGAQLSAAGLLLANESTHAPAVIYGLSAPQVRQRWLGNLFRYGLRAPASALEPPAVIGRDGEPALDPESGFLQADSRSDWSDAPDGEAPLVGGAAGRLPAADSRRLYSDLTEDALTSARNRLVAGNASLSAALLGLGPHDSETPDQVIAWLLNERNLGDPGLQAPVTAGDLDDESRTVYLTTHDGLLHAFDADTGVERWAFLPKALLPRLPDLMRDEATTVRSHGIDGSPVLHRHDPDGDGHIDPSAGEHLWLLFGLGRGGSGHYALDVASPDEPRLLWSLGPTAPGEDAESWPEPVIARLMIDGTGQGPGAWVVVLAGGYDRAYDFADPGSGATGASLSILDALTGRLLWRAAGNTALQPDLHLPGMTASLASAPRVLDLDGDGHADRLYAVDIEGGLWRIDLRNGATPANLAHAWMLARLGDGGQRFHSSPDISVIQQADGFQIAISVGSGWLARPRDATITDRLYSIRDREFAVGAGFLRDADLHDATEARDPMPVAAPGWFVRLEAHGSGEKVVSSSVTFDHRLHFVTYQPLPASPSAVCGPPQAVRRLRTLDVRTGLPAPLSNVPGDPAERELAGSGLPSQLRFAFPGPWDGSCSDCRARPFGLAGSELFDTGFANDPIKTSWRKLPNEPDSR